MLREVIKEDPSPYVKYIEYIEEDKVLGYLKYSLIYDRMEIDNILVEPEYRGQKMHLSSCCSPFYLSIDLIVSHNCVYYCCM